MKKSNIPNLGIVIVNWNSGKELEKCLESIKKAGYEQSVTIVDNEKNNVGYGGGNNQGIKYFLGQGKKYIFILNPDTQLKNDTIGKLIREMEKDEFVGITGPKILLPTPRGSHGLRRHFSLPPTEVFLPRIWSCGGVIDNHRYSGGLIGNREIDKGQYEKVKEVDYISGTAMMVRSEVFKKIGLFPTSYFMYYEDVEFCQKAKKAGFKVLFVPSSVIIHNESSSIGKNSPAQEYYMARNHLLFVERNAPLRVKMRELVRLPKTLYEHIKRGEKYALLGIRDYFLRRFGKNDYSS